MKQKIKIWDVPTRLFHWALPVLMILMYVSAKQGGDWLQWHLRGGLLLLGLLVFRVCWGIFGSQTAQFRQFVQPRKIVSYLKGNLSHNETVGHNPLGALMVVALIVMLCFQVITGLFASDENTFLYHGYFNQWVSPQTASLIRSIHLRFFNLLALFALVHIVVVVGYRVLKKQDFITPMITGYQEKTGNVSPPKFAGVARLILALLIAMATVVAVRWV